MVARGGGRADEDDQREGVKGGRDARDAEDGLGIPEPRAAQRLGGVVRGEEDKKGDKGGPRSSGRGVGRDEERDGRGRDGRQGLEPNVDAGHAERTGAARVKKSDPGAPLGLPQPTAVTVIWKCEM